MPRKDHEKRRAYDAAYRATHIEEIATYRATHAKEKAAHPEKSRAYSATYRATHREKNCCLWRCTC